MSAKRKVILYSFGILLCLSALLPSQIDVADKNYMESTGYYLTADTGQSNYSATLIFKFQKEAGRYQYMMNRDTLVIDFYEAYCNPNTVRGKVSTPFEDLKITASKENMRSIENLSPSAMDVVHIELPLMKGVKPRISTANVRQVVTVEVIWPKDGEAAKEEDEYSSHLVRNIIIGATVVLAVVGILYLIENTSKQKTDEVVQQ
jgi:hypothetical protein